MELKNRIVMAPMGTFSHGQEGFIQERTVHYYVEHAKGGVGFIIAQSSNALREGRAPEFREHGTTNSFPDCDKSLMPFTPRAEKLLGRSIIMESFTALGWIASQTRKR